MAEHVEESNPKAEPVEESVLKAEPRSFTEKIKEKIHEHKSSSSSSSSDSDNDKSEFSSSVKTRLRRLFGREKPVHQVLGGGKRPDMIFAPYTEGPKGVGQLRIMHPKVAIFKRSSHCRIYTLVPGKGSLFVFSIGAQVQHE